MSNQRYASVFTDDLTESHLILIRATQVNSTLASLPRSRSDVTPELCLIEWDDDVAQRIPEAVEAIQQLIDAGVTIRNHDEVLLYLDDPEAPFAPLPTDLP